MLSLQLKSGDYLTIGDEIAVQIFQQPGGAFSVSVKAPREIPILRGKVLERSGDDRPDCLRDRAPKRPSVRARNARNMEGAGDRRRPGNALYPCADGQHGGGRGTAAGDRGTAGPSGDHRHGPRPQRRGGEPVGGAAQNPQLRNRHIIFGFKQSAQAG